MRADTALEHDDLAAAQIELDAALALDATHADNYANLARRLEASRSSAVNLARRLEASRSSAVMSAAVLSAAVAAAAAAAAEWLREGCASGL